MSTMRRKVYYGMIVETGTKSYECMLYVKLITKISLNVIIIIR